LILIELDYGDYILVESNEPISIEGDHFICDSVDMD